MCSLHFDSDKRIDIYFSVYFLRYIRINIIIIIIIILGSTEARRLYRAIHFSISADDLNLQRIEYNNFIQVDCENFKLTFKNKSELKSLACKVPKPATLSQICMLNYSRKHYRS